MLKCAMGEGNMKTIAIVATGGTIAGRGQIGKAVAYHAGEMDVNEIIQSIPMLNQVAHIKGHHSDGLFYLKKLMNL